MMHILVVDDEQNIISEIKGILEKDLKIPFSIHEATNGKDALAICKSEQIDLVITDIQMPVMDGLELMSHISKLKPKPAIIVISKSDKFEYARHAIKAGAVAYILKPLDKEELLRAVVDVGEKSYRTKRIQNQSVLQRSIATGYPNHTALFSGSGLEAGLRCMAICGQGCAEELRKLLEEKPFYFLEEKNDFALCVIPDKLLDIVKNWHFDWLYAAGISHAEQSLSQLRQLRSQAYSAMFQVFFTSGKARAKKIFVFSDDMFLPDFSDFDAAYERFIGRLEFLEAEEITDGVLTLLDFSNVPEQKRGSVLYYMYNKIVSNLFRRFPGHIDPDTYLYLKGIAIENIWQAGTLAEWQGFVCDYLVYLATLLQKHTANYPFITEAIDYIKAHFTGSLNMAMVANHVSVNYTYFSEKFKEHTGINFNDYLKRVRIEEACRLLTEGFYKVYEVSSRSGFNDVKYFMRTFKDIVGMTPGEYRRSRNHRI